MNNNFDGFNGLYGPGPYAVLAELGRQKGKGGKMRNSVHYEGQAWLWKHKLLFFVGGVLLVAALVIGGSGA